MLVSCILLVPVESKVVVLFCSWTGNKPSALSRRFWTPAALAYFQVWEKSCTSLSCCKIICSVLLSFGISHFCFCFFFLFLLMCYFRLLGTPNEEMWPGVSKLPNWHEYPQWSPKPLSSAVPNLDKDGLDLLSVSFTIKIVKHICWKMNII